ncbi:hypothetical protein GCM10011409_28510 [Lentibacillus populi]|uniref:Uncharacterized protein n=1 Tax=Lentibacillus populi TaxID=1827502 RepID=A0A9W5TYZ6_9BACI|nr:hypothetical protein GCM10011409_28510 [Lentibacillus populi]
MMASNIVLEEQPPYSASSLPDYDGLWKKLIEELFEELMEFLAPDLYREIDFSIAPAR